MPGSSPRALPARERHPDRWLATGFFLLAVAVRLGVVRSSGGFAVLNGYDDGVYFSATKGLLHGLVPYRDFVLLHPPGILVLGAGPVSLADALGLSDTDSLVLIRVLFVLLGGLNSVLVFLAGRHLSRSAGIVAACLYAVWSPAIREERTMLLEPIVILGTLAGLVLVPAVTNRDVQGRWRPVVAGLAGGVAVATKLWAIVPVLVIAGGVVVVRRWRTAVAYAGTAAVTALAVVGPFLALAPSQMWSMLVESQAGRPVRGENRLARFAEIGNLQVWPFSALADPAWPPMAPVNPADAQEQFFGSGRAPVVVAAVVVAVTALSIVVAVRLPQARVWVALLTIQSAVLLATPIFYDGYASFLAPAGVLVVGACGHLVWTSARIRGHPARARAAAALFALGIALVGWGAVQLDRGAPISPPVAPLVASARCVASDSPAALVLAERLSTNLENDCPAVFDFSGIVYTLEHQRTGTIGPTRLRSESAQFQQFVRDYFGQADYVILRRRTMTGISPETMAIIERRPLIRARTPRVYGPLGGIGADATPDDSGAAPEEPDDDTDDPG